MKTALFSYPGDKVPSGGMLPGKDDLFRKLQERDIDPRVSFQAENAFADGVVDTHHLVGESGSRHAGNVALENVGVIVNRLDRSFRLDDLPEPWQEGMPPVENNNTLRSLAFRKNRVQAELLEPLGLGMPTSLIEAPADVDAFLESVVADEYIIKPTSGTFSKGIERVAKNQVATYFRDHPDQLGKVIIQPAYNFGLKIPDSIHPYDALAREDFDAVAKSDMIKEFRVYGMYSPEKTIVFPVLRGIKDGTDNWAAVDPESFPAHVLKDAQDVVERAAHLTGSRAIYAALDVGYGQLDNAEPQFQQIEFNGRMPYLLGKDKHVAAANVLRDHFADQIAASARSGSDKL